MQLRLVRSRCGVDRPRAVEYAESPPVAQETHRRGILFNPWVTRDAPGALPGLYVCCDLSPRLCVAERLPPDWDAIVDLSAARCVHILAMVSPEISPPDLHTLRRSNQPAADLDGVLKWMPRRLREEFCAAGHG